MVRCHQQRRSNAVEREQSPNEPSRTRWPIAERSLLMPEASQSPGCSSKKIGRVIGEWRDQGSSYDKRHSQARTRSRKKPAAPLRSRLLHTNNPERRNISDMKKIVESDDQSEAAPALAIDHGKGLPPARRAPAARRDGTPEPHDGRAPRQ